MLRSFKEQAAFGLPYERAIARLAAMLLYPGRPDLELFRLQQYSPVDFFLRDRRMPVAALEVKRRSVHSSTYETTLLPHSVYVAAQELDRLTIPTFAAILYVDGLAVFDVLSTPSSVRYLRNRRGWLRKHREYSIEGRLVRIDAVHQ